MSNRRRKQESLDYHKLGRPGKIEVIPTKKHSSQRDLSLAYSPGVAVPCEEISKNPELAYDYTNKGIDQLKYIINSLKDKEKRYSRRLIMSAWNPCQLNEMALPPCHVLVQFNVIDDKLSCALTQRSCDIGLGVPFNILSYSLLTHLIAKHCDLEVDEFVYFMGNVHIYDDHIEPLKKQIENDILEFPTLRINSKRDTIDDYRLEDFELLNYKHNEVINMKMRK